MDCHKWIVKAGSGIVVEMKAPMLIDLAGLDTYALQVVNRDGFFVP